MTVSPPKIPPRFVPTLTEVVHAGAVPVPDSLTAASSSEPWTPVPAERPAKVHTAPAEGPPDTVPEGFEEFMVHRVMQRVDVMLDKRLREAIASVVQEQTRSVLPRLREEIESVVRHSVYEAVADELACGLHSKTLR